MKTVSQFLPALNKTVEVVGLKVKDFDLLTNQQKMASGDALNEMFKNCTVDKTIDTMGLLSGDRNALLIGIRRATFGDTYEFSIRSPFQQGKNPQVFEIDLSQLEFMEGDRKCVDAMLADPKVSFPYQLASGEKIQWRLTDGNDMKKAMTILRGENKATADLLVRIVSAESASEKGVPLKRWVSELEAEDMMEFNEFYTDKAPAVDDRITLTCQETGQEFEARLEFSVENFFKRTSRKKT